MLNSLLGVGGLGSGAWGRGLGVGVGGLGSGAWGRGLGVGGLTFSCFSTVGSSIIIKRLSTSSQTYTCMFCNSIIRSLFVFAKAQHLLNACKQLMISTETVCVTSYRQWSNIGTLPLCSDVNLL